MRTRFFLFCFLIATTAARADLKWAATTVFTAAMPSEGKATAEFDFTNTGNYPIKITGTRTSCGCTAAITDDRIVQPGGTGKVGVSFKTLNRRGLYEEPIIVYTNDPAAKQQTVTLRVLIREAVVVLPTLLFWQEGEPLTPKVIQITVTEGFEVKDVTATCKDPGLDVKLATVKPGSAYKLTVTPKAAHVKATIAVAPDVVGRQSRVIMAHVRVS